MTLKAIFTSIQGLEGNLSRENENVFISQVNMESFVKRLEECSDISSILITPYLINTDDYALYELHYYEFELDVIMTDKSYFVEYAKGNVLPKEIVDNFKPKAIVAQGDSLFLITALSNYLEKMRNMTFDRDRNADKRLEKAELFYQVF